MRLEKECISLMSIRLNQSNDSPGLLAARSAHRILFLECIATPDELYIEFDNTHAIFPAFREL